jgi:hypothetical protein
MKDLTEEEYDALDDYYTRNPPAVDPAKNRLAERSFRVVALDGLSADYLVTKAITDHKTPSEIIGEMVRERISASTEPAR